MIVEIVGNAGAGKSTLSRLLKAQLPDAEIITAWRQLRYLPDFVTGSLQLLPLLIADGGLRRTLSFARSTQIRQELNWMIRLATSLRAMQTFSQTAQNEHLVLLDQGPIYTLMRIMERENFAASDATSQWLHKMLCAWSTILDAVIWLEAPNALLLERVIARPKEHWLQQCTSADALAILERHRQLYQQLLAELEKADHCRVLRHDTSSAEPALVADEIYTAIMAHTRNTGPSLR